MRIEVRLEEEERERIQTACGQDADVDRILGIVTGAGAREAIGHPTRRGLVHAP